VFDVDAFVSDCIAARRESEPRLAVKEVLARALADPGRVADVLPPTRAEIQPLHVSDELTILKVVWAAGMTLGAHDHRMWATIGIYTGGEDNTLYRRAGSTVVESGHRELRVGDTLLLGDDAVHAVHNPTSVPAGAIHVYGGDFFATARSEWRGEPPTEEPYDVQRVLALFAAANG
jgi:predicted metal-dependent enzyme (double-stranded beta helix superfamily)